MEKDQWMTEIVTFINNSGGEISLKSFNKFFKSNSDWKRLLSVMGAKGICENSNGILTWRTDSKGKVIVCTNDGQCERFQLSGRSCPAAGSPEVNYCVVVFCSSHSMIGFIWPND